MIYKLYTTWSTIHNLVGVARGGGGGCGWCLKINGENHKRWGMDHIDIKIYVFTSNTSTIVFDCGKQLIICFYIDTHWNFWYVQFIVGI